MFRRKKQWLAVILVAILCISGCGKQKEEKQAKEQVSESVSKEEADELSDTVETAQSQPQPQTQMTTLPQAGVRSFENLLKTAMEPVGQTMYIWGGGWNEADTGAGEEAVHIGVSPNWAAFAEKQDASYDYNTTRYQIHDGLDCSGYIGWLVYNVFHDTDGTEADGYVMKAGSMAETFASYGWGEFTPAGSVTDWKPGDIMSMPGHVWMSLGMCEDGSVVLLHASPPGVRICGTKLSGGSMSQAEMLAEQYMQDYYPQWYNRFPDSGVDASYLQKSGRFRFHSETLSDEAGVSQMSAADVLTWMYDGVNE
ncbi:MAG: hypothetical protein ACI4HI_13760 [Lachnospiraceae bacterium]